MKTLVSSTICALVLFAGTAAADSKCQDFTIEIDNDYQLSGDPKDIKVVDLEYYDYEDTNWRNEVLGDQIVSYHDDVDEWEKNLEYIGGEDTVLRVWFRYDVGAGWSSLHSVDSPRFRCIDGESIRIVVQ